MFDGYGSRVAFALALGAFGAVAVSGDLHAQGLKVVGYGDFEWTLQQTGDPDDEWHHFFDNHHINLILLGWVIDDLVVGVEVEYEHAGDEIVLEYGYLAYTGIRNLRLAAGKFILPFNRWNKDLHPTWISKMPGRPLVYGNVFPSTYSDVGVWASGAGPLGDGARVTYDAYVINGAKGEADEANFRDLRENDRERPERDDNKAVGGRLGLELPPGLGLGVSGYTGKYAEDEAAEENLQLTFLGADVDYGISGLEVRGEFVHARQDLTGGATNERTGFYAQAAYLLSAASEQLANFEPVVRYSWVNFEGDASDTQELGIGLNYYVSASSAVRVAWFFNLEEDGFKEDNNKLMGQFVIAF